MGILQEVISIIRCASRIGSDFFKDDGAIITYPFSCLLFRYNPPTILVLHDPPLPFVINKDWFYYKRIKERLAPVGKS